MRARMPCKRCSSLETACPQAAGGSLFVTALARGPLQPNENLLGQEPEAEKMTIRLAAFACDARRESWIILRQPLPRRKESEPPSRATRRCSIGSRKLPG